MLLPLYFLIMKALYIGCCHCHNIANTEIVFVLYTLSEYVLYYFVSTICDFTAISVMGILLVICYKVKCD